MSIRNIKADKQLCPACHEKPAEIVECPHCGAENTAPCQYCQHYPFKCKECGYELTDFKVKPEDEFEGPKIQNNPDSTKPNYHDLSFLKD